MANLLQSAQIEQISADSGIPSVSLHQRGRVLAGRYSDKFKNFYELPIGFPDHGTYRGKPLMQIAFDLTKVIERRTFSEIAESILKFR
jgi:hypothetical protein